MLNRESNESNATHDPYAVLEKGIQKLQLPISDLLRSHNELVVQNLSIMSNLATIPKLDQDLKTRLNKE